MPASAYGLLPGRQYTVWALVVDDTAAREQRAASAALTHGPDAAASGEHASCDLFPDSASIP
jgi:hypothetical protein